MAFLLGGVFLANTVVNASCAAGASNMGCREVSHGCFHLASIHSFKVAEGTCC